MNPQKYNGLVNRFGRQVELAPEIKKALLELKLTELRAFSKGEGEVTITAEEFCGYDKVQKAFNIIGGILTESKASYKYTAEINFIQIPEIAYRKEFLDGQALMPG